MNYKKELMRLLIISNLLLGGCSLNKKEVIDLEIEQNKYDVNIEIEPVIDLTINNERSLDDITFIDSLVTTKFAVIRETPGFTSSIISSVNKDTKITDYVREGNYFKVNYNGVTGYISNSDAIVSLDVDFPYTYKSLCCVIEDTVMTNGEEEIITIPKNEVAYLYEIYDDNKALVKYDEYAGYIDTFNFSILDGTFVVVDISDQNLKMYNGVEEVLSTPIVSGKPSTPSDTGLFSMYEITTDRYLIGEDYKCYVDVMMAYNGGEGLHDAEYHNCVMEHGWRKSNEFGGETYLTDGSHGCINMLHDDAMEVYENTSIGTKVLVKE